MSKGRGGKQPHMRNGYFLDSDGNHIIQAITIAQDEEIPKKMWGQPKGLQIVLQERGLWSESGLYLDGIARKQKHHGDQCCARQVLAQQPDFKAQVGRVQEVVEGRGHLILFYPKFHCELNWIQYLWARVKVSTRAHCSYDIKSLRDNVPAALVWASNLIPK